MKLINVHSHFPTGAYTTVLQETTSVTTSFSSLGIHPVLDAEKASHQFNILQKCVVDKTIIAIGESGFDKNSTLSANEQIALFRSQMILSEESDLPLIIHCVGRWNELELMFKEKKPGTPLWIIHGFRKMKLAGKFLQLGAYLSFGEAILFDDHVKTAIPDIPIERIFLETDDAEFDIERSYHELARLKGISVAEVCGQMQANFEKVFYSTKSI